jgi:hypothetical protein
LKTAVRLFSFMVVSSNKKAVSRQTQQYLLKGGNGICINGLAV